ncbi:MAG: Ig-like domain-containing protein [Verrucomicrobiota bacterium]
MNGSVNLRSFFTDTEDLAAGLTYTVQTNTNNSLVTTSINNSTDVLTLDYADNVSGTANLTIRATDTVGLLVEDTFLVTVNAVNDKPGFTAPPATQTNEDAGAQSVPSFATGFTPGPANESAQTVASYAVSNISAPTLFATPPAVAANGTLTYTPAANANGISTFQLRVQDNGGTANGGVDLSDPLTVTITVNAVNDKPTFTAAAPPAVNENAGAQSVGGFITGFTAGPANESSQTALGFSVSAVSRPALFVAGPTVIGGALNYTPAANAIGSSTFEVRVTDSGGTANGGVAVSDPQVFTIAVNPTREHIIGSAKILPEPGGGFRISFVGNPGQSYTVQYSATMNAADWHLLSSVIVGANAVGSIVDVPPVNTPKRFFRFVVP